MDRTRLSRHPDCRVLAFLLAFGLFENPAGGRPQGFHLETDLQGLEDSVRMGSLHGCPPSRAGMVPNEDTWIDSCAMSLPSPLIPASCSEPTGSEIYHAFLSERLKAVAVVFCSLIHRLFCSLLHDLTEPIEAKIPQCIIISPQATTRTTSRWL